MPKTKSTPKRAIATHASPPAGYPVASKTAESRVLKRLAPMQPGTLKQLRRYGDALVCVRYREDSERALRLTTVELVVEQRPIRPRGDPTVRVRIDFDEDALRQRAKDLGAQWHQPSRAWAMPYSVAERLQLVDRIVRR